MQMLTSLREEYDTVVALGAQVIAVSGDSLDSHVAFSESLGGCPFPLASDPHGDAAKLFGAMGPDGRVRAVYVLDESGIVVHKVPWYQPGNIGHLMSVFEALGMDGDPA